MWSPSAEELSRVVSTKENNVEPSFQSKSEQEVSGSNKKDAEFFFYVEVLLLTAEASWKISASWQIWLK